MANRVSFIILAKDSFTKVANKVSKSTKLMKKNFKGLDSGIKALTRKFAALAGAVLSYVGVTRFFREGIAFEKAIPDLSAITGAAGKDLQFLSDESMRRGKIARVSSTQTGEAFKLVASAKAELLEDPKALSNVTEQLLLLANASGV